MLIYNGVMVGAFQYFFAERGLFSESFLTIWMHGALELSAAVIAGGAGLILGRGIVFPGTYSRLQSLMISAREGLKVLMIAVSMTTVAAIIESFLTRYTEIPNAIRLCFIALCFLFVIGYFIVLPWQKKKNGSILPKRGERIMPDLNQHIVLDEIKGVGKLFSEGFVIYRRFFSQYLPFILFLAVAYTLLNMLFSYELIDTRFQMYYSFFSGPFYPITWTFENLSRIFSSGLISTVNLFNILLTACCFGLVLYYTSREMIASDLIPAKKANSVKAIAIGTGLALILNLMFNIDPWLSAGIIIIVPVFLVITSAMYLDGKNLNQSMDILRGSAMRAYGVYFSFLLIGVILFTLFTFPVFSLVFMLGNLLFGIDSIDPNQIYIALYLFFTSLAILLILPPIISGIMLTSFTGKEIVTAGGLRKRLATISEEEGSKSSGSR